MGRGKDKKRDKLYLESLHCTQQQNPEPMALPVCSRMVDKGEKRELLASRCEAPSAAGWKVSMLKAQSRYG